MIPESLAAEIRRLFFAEHWKVGTIATQLRLHHSTVRRVLFAAGVEQPQPEIRPSMVDPFIPFIRETLAKYPRLRASRLFEMVKERGYPGRQSHFRYMVAKLRPQPVAEAYLRLATLPGEQAQVDWAHFGKHRVGNAERRLLAFVMTLSWSRHIFVRFYYGDATSNFHRAHVEAFAFFGGVPRTLLYDNLKTAVIERVGDAIRFNEGFLRLADHYRFAPRPVAIARGNEKGRVERAIQYIRHAFYAARPWKDIDDLNAQAEAWCLGAAADRICAEDRKMTVRDAFASERERLLALPDNPFPCDERVEVHVGKTPYVRFDLNDYSVPHTLTRRTLTVIASLDTVRILDGNEVVATHLRTFDRDQPIENPDHIAALVEHKAKARQHRGLDRLRYAAPSSRMLLERIAERGGNLGSATVRLNLLLDTYGPEELEIAIAEALAADAPHAHGVRLILDRRRHARHLPPALPVPLPDKPGVSDVVVRPHSLDAYDRLASQEQPDAPDDLQ